MVGAELDSADLAKLTVAEMLKRQIIINCTSDTVLRFLPPYLIERSHIDTAVAALDEIFTQNAAALSGAQNTHAAGGQHVASKATIERGNPPCPFKTTLTFSTLPRVLRRRPLLDCGPLGAEVRGFSGSAPRKAQPARLPPCSRCKQMVLMFEKLACARS